MSNKFDRLSYSVKFLACDVQSVLYSRQYTIVDNKHPKVNIRQKSIDSSVLTVDSRHVWLYTVQMPP